MSDLGYALARVLIPLVFIAAGWTKLMDVTGVTAMLTRAGLPEPRLLGYAAAILELVAGIMVFIGFKARWAALALFFFTAGTIYISHAFWAMDAAQYVAQRMQALKNLAIMGGLLLIVVGGSGRLSLDRR